MSELRVDSVKSKGGGAPDLPKGVTISGIATAATLGATTIDVSNVNVSGVVTSGTLSGSLLSTGTPTLGLGVTINSSGVAISGVATAGIVSATTLYGDGTNITGVGATLAPLFYQPDPYDTGVVLDAGIGITFNSQLKAGTGNVTLSIANAGVAGTVVENFGVGSSVSISENRITINPTADLSVGGDYIISYPSGCFTNNEGTDYVGTAYTFQARPLENQLWMWGHGSEGALAQNNTVDYSSPVQIPGTNWKNISARSDARAYHSLATKTDGTLWIWGWNEEGTLGMNNPNPSGRRSSPVQLPGTWGADASLFAGNQWTSVINTDGELWMWGQNTNGVLGQNNRTSYSSPVQIPGTTWRKYEGDNSFGFSIATKTDGTLWSWGYAGYGQLGISSRTRRSSPVQVPGTTWNDIDASKYNSIATKTDGTLWIWGQNVYGSLGQNQAPGSPTNRSSPVQIPGTTWSKVAGGEQTVGAIKTDGTLWMWGYNFDGQLGLNTQMNSGISSPAQIPGTTWESLWISAKAVGAKKTDGTIWSWGYNWQGSLGLNQSTPRISSPTQIGSDTTWTKYEGGYQVMGMKQI